MNDELTVSNATEEDAGSISEIFAHYVLESAASFETTPPDAATMRGRIGRVLSQGYPWLVVRNVEGRIVGFAYAERFGAHESYAYSCETHTYVASDSLGSGVGTMLITTLVAACEARGYRQAFAMIAGTEPAAVVLHARAGYLPCGTLASAGWKHGQWIDVFVMQRKLGPGNETLPDGHV